MIFCDLPADCTTLNGVRIITYFQIHSIMQNKPKVKYTKINVNSYMKSIYAKMDIWLFRQTKPKQTQFKPN